MVVATRPKSTVLAPPKPVPVMTTLVPPAGWPATGLRALTLGVAS